jgi:hypothetical protein
MQIGKLEKYIARRPEQGHTLTLSMESLSGDWEHLNSWTGDALGKISPKDLGFEVLEICNNEANECQEKLKFRLSWITIDQKPISNITHIQSPTEGEYKELAESGALATGRPSGFISQLMAHNHFLCGENSKLSKAAAITALQASETYQRIISTYQEQYKEMTREMAHLNRTITELVSSNVVDEEERARQESREKAIDIGVDLLKENLPNIIAAIGSGSPNPEPPSNSGNGKL